MVYRRIHIGILVYRTLWFSVYRIISVFWCTETLRFFRYTVLSRYWNQYRIIFAVVYTVGLRIITSYTVLSLSLHRRTCSRSTMYRTWLKLLLLYLRQYSRIIILSASRHIRCVKCLESGVRAQIICRRLYLLLLLLLCRSRVNEVIALSPAGPRFFPRLNVYLRSYVL